MHKYEWICFCKWCQDLPPARLAALLKDLGFDGVDLPCRPSAPVTHANGPEKLSEYKQAFEDHGLKLVRLVTSLKEADAETEHLLEAIQSLGIEKIRIGGFSVAEGEHAVEKLDEARRRLAALQPLLAKHGVKGGIQNHSGNCLEVNVSSCLLLLQDCDPEWIGVQYDPGHLRLSGENDKIALELLGPRLHSVNLKSPRHAHSIDAKSGRLLYTPVWVPLRDGMLDVAAELAALSQVGYTDAISLHAEYRTYFYRVENVLETTNDLMREDVAYVRSLM